MVTREYPFISGIYFGKPYLLQSGQSIALEYAKLDLTKWLANQDEDCR